MDKRENLLRAVRRDLPNHVPLSLSLCDSLRNLFIKKTGTDDYLNYFGIPFRNVSPRPSLHKADYSSYYHDIPEGTVIDEWGIGHVPGSLAHFEKMLHPMAAFTSIEQVDAFPLPDILSDYRWKGMEERVRKIKNQGLAVASAAIQIFEPAWYLRGLENLLMDMMTDEGMARACLDRMTCIGVAMARKFALSDVDILICGDDVGTQRGMMMHPRTWREWLKPTMDSVIKAAKDVKPDLIVYYHSDGDIEDIIPDLIEIGVDILNPVQPECMDPVKIKNLYGDCLSFWGTIGTQKLMPFGSPEEINNVVRERIETVGKGGGLVIAPTHLLEPEVPWENILALAEAVRKYGPY